MSPFHARLILVVTLLGAALAAATTQATQPIQVTQATRPAGVAAARWFKGNTHAHTLNSDGDSTPDEVVRWYREHRYQFLVLTDHNYLTHVEGLNAVHGAADQFLVIQGEEVTSRSGDKPIHVNGLAVQSLVQPPGPGGVLAMLQGSVDGIRAARGVPHVNHPNYEWAITAEELRQLERTRLFEIFNGHPRVNNLGGGGAPGLEEMWDTVLTAGRLMYGLAVDDAHYFKRPGDVTVPLPGTGWVMVRADRLDGRLLLDALERGDFYATTGIELSNYDVSAEAIRIDVRADAWSRYRVQFIGPGGRVIDEQARLPAVYRLRGDEGYVRARIVESNGRMAWTQPVPIGPNAPR
ncbi:MAG: CehA/McbA family metallohydrolase [Acidobacteriota bacterium]